MPEMSIGKKSHIAGPWPSRGIESLLLFISNADPLFRPNAVALVLHRGIERVAPVLERAVRNDADADLRNAAMEVLVAFGEAAVPRLVALLGDANEEVRNFCTVMLGDIGSRTAVDPLISALRDPDVNVRHGAAEALGRIGDARAVEPLLELFVDHFWLQHAVVVALGKIGDRRATCSLLLRRHDPLLAEPVIEALGRIGDPDALAPLMDDLDGSFAERVAMAARGIVLLVNGCFGKDRRGAGSPGEYFRSFADDIGSHVIMNLGGMKSSSADGGTAAAAVTLLQWLAGIDRTSSCRRSG